MDVSAVLADNYEPLVLDIGGEGRHRKAWNLNPSSQRTAGRLRGELIPRHLPGRADAIPLPDRCVARVLAERTPLNRAALAEIVRVISPQGEITLRHAIPTGIDPHRLAKQVFSWPYDSRRIVQDGRELQETVWRAE